MSELTPEQKELTDLINNNRSRLYCFNGYILLGVVNTVMDCLIKETGKAMKKNPQATEEQMKDMVEISSLKIALMMFKGLNAEQDLVKLGQIPGGVSQICMVPVKPPEPSFGQN